MAHDIFISHSSKDKPIADAVCATFEANGMRCWIAPRDVPPGAAWGEAIVDAIQASRVMVLVFSENANTSGQIAREVECAASHGLTIVPIRTEDVAPARTLQFFLSNIHWLDALSPPLERRLQEIAAKLKPMIARDGARPAAPRTLAVHPQPRVWSKRWAIGAGVVVFLALLALVWRPWARPEVSAAVDPALVGRWAYVTTFLDTEVHLEFTLDAAGRYTFRRFMEADGTVEAKDGSAKVIDNKKKQFPIKATYVFPSDDKLIWSVPVLSVVPDFRAAVTYKRAGGARVPENPLVGKWKGTMFLFNLNWDAVWDVRPDSSFHVVFDNIDEGNFTASEGKWEAKSNLSRPVETGIYRNVTPESFEMSDRFFQILRFERAPAGSGK